MCYHRDCAWADFLRERERERFPLVCRYSRRTEMQTRSVWHGRLTINQYTLLVGFISQFVFYTDYQLTFETLFCWVDYECDYMLAGVTHVDRWTQHVNVTILPEERAQIKSHLKFNLNDDNHRHWGRNVPQVFRLVIYWFGAFTMVDWWISTSGPP